MSAAPQPAPPAGSSPLPGAPRCHLCPAAVERCPRPGCWCRGWRHTGTRLHFGGQLGDRPHLAAPGSAALDIIDAIGLDPRPYRGDEFG